MFERSWSIISGVVVGIYITQNYNVPPIKDIFSKFHEEIKKIEKENRK